MVVARSNRSRIVDVNTALSHEVVAAVTDRETLFIGRATGPNTAQGDAAGTKTVAETLRLKHENGLCTVCCNRSGALR